jgi:hypothetical protein
LEPNIVWNQFNRLSAVLRYNALVSGAGDWLPTPSNRAWGKTTWCFSPSLFPKSQSRMAAPGGRPPGPVYNNDGEVKGKRGRRHLGRRHFALVESSFSLHKTKDSVLFKSIGGSLVLHQPSIRSVPPTMIIHSNSQTFSGRQSAHSNQRPIVRPQDQSGYPACEWRLYGCCVFHIQYSRTASLRATITLATAECFLRLSR